MSEERALTTIEGGQLARYSPMDALATMSDAEFEQRLSGLKKAQERMARIHRDIMERDTHYGVIPGTGNKPTLLKPGAELLCKLHHLVPTFDQRTIIGDGTTAPHIRVLTTCSLHYETEDGPVVAQGVGASNSWEKKYRYRDAQRACPSCGAAAIIKGKAEYGGGWLCWAKKGGCGAKFSENDPAIVGQQVGQTENPDPYDGENTLEKMSAKRGQTDATLRATATSGLFSQDQEEAVEPAAKPEPKADQPAPAQPKPTPKAAPKATGQPGAEIVVEPSPMPQSHLCAECVRQGRPSTITEHRTDKRLWTADQIAQRTLETYGEKLCWVDWQECLHADKVLREQESLDRAVQAVDSGPAATGV